MLRLRPHDASALDPVMPTSTISHYNLPPTPITPTALSLCTDDTVRQVKRRRSDDGHDPLSPVSDLDDPGPRRVRIRTESHHAPAGHASAVAAPATPSASPSPTRDSPCDSPHVLTSCVSMSLSRESRESRYTTPVDGLDLEPVRPESPDLSDHVHDAIETQFGLEILIKHNELRLINQELAKCQIALEQLRRCHLIPYPTNYPTPTEMLRIVAGEGPVYQTQPDQTVPAWAPPFGVVDGPYSRHYAKWLIPDPVFDGLRLERRTAAREPRPTRHRPATRASKSNKSRAPRGPSSQKPEASSSGTLLPKDKDVPCIVRRSDGQLVQLICPDCQRAHFGSTQGFINHCRISHRREFKSHDEAAVSCGLPLDSSAFAIPAPERASDTKAAPVLAPTLTSASTRATQSVAIPGVLASTARSIVHPLIRSDISDTGALTSLRNRLARSVELYTDSHETVLTRPRAGYSDRVLPNGSTDTEKVYNDSLRFVAAIDTPYLSDLMQSRKFDGDLSDLVNDARTTVADALVGQDGTMSVEDGPEPRDFLVTHPQLSSRSIGGDSPLACPDEHEPCHDPDVDMDSGRMSPHLAASNNAPSLVSDDGENDESDMFSEAESGLGCHSLVIAEPRLAIADDHDTPPRGDRRHRTPSAVMAPPPPSLLKLARLPKQPSPPLMAAVSVKPPEPRRRGRPRKHQLPPLIIPRPPTDD